MKWIKTKSGFWIRRRKSGWVELYDSVREKTRRIGQVVLQGKLEGNFEFERDEWMRTHEAFGIACILEHYAERLGIKRLVVVHGKTPKGWISGWISIKKIRRLIAEGVLKKYQDPKRIFEKQWMVTFDLWKRFDV